MKQLKPLLKPCREVKVSKGTYVIESIPQGFIINDLQHGLILLNQAMETVRKIKLFDGILIYHAFRKFDGTKLFLDCVDNELFAAVNLETDYAFYFENKETSPRYFHHVYSWRTSLIISTYERDFYLLEAEQQQLLSISEKTVERHDPLLLKFREIIMHYSIERSYPENYQFIYTSYEKQIVGFYSMTDNREVILKYHDWHNPMGYGYVPRFFDAHYLDDGIFILVDEYVIEIRKGKSVTYIYPPPRFAFARSTIYMINDQPHLVVIARDDASEKESLLQQYRIPQEF